MQILFPGVYARLQKKKVGCDGHKHEKVLPIVSIVTCVLQLAQTKKKRIVIFLTPEAREGDDNQSSRLRKWFQ